MNEEHSRDHVTHVKRIQSWPLRGIMLRKSPDNMQAMVIFWKNNVSHLLSPNKEEHVIYIPQVSRQSPGKMRVDNVGSSDTKMRLKSFSRHILLLYTMILTKK